MNDWISCEDRLPDNSEPCLVIYHEYDVYRGDFSEEKQYRALSFIPEYGMWNIKAIIKITHWQPLPEPPKG